VNYLSEHKNLCIKVQASDTFELIHKLKTTPVDLLLMDIYMPPLEGTDALQMIRYEFPDLKILLLSMSTDVDLISNMLDLGIHGFISKDDEPENLLNAIEAISNNKIYHTRLFVEALFRNKQHNIRTDTTKPLVLNEREKKVLKLLWDEKSNKDIADDLFLSVRSVEKIRQDLKDKLGVKSTIGLLKYAIQQKIIEPENKSAQRVHNRKADNYKT
jgi:two-component system nitrate/nitrite response regulator NarL